MENYKSLLLFNLASNLAKYTDIKTVISKTVDEEKIKLIEFYQNQTDIGKIMFIDKSRNFYLSNTENQYELFCHLVLREILKNYNIKSDNKNISQFKREINGFNELLRQGKIDIFMCGAYDTIISFDDIQEYFENKISFYKLAERNYYKGVPSNLVSFLEKPDHFLIKTNGDYKLTTFIYDFLGGDFHSAVFDKVFSELRLFILNFKFNLKQVPKAELEGKSNLQLNSFQSNLTQTQLEKLFQELIKADNGFIHSETTPEQFKQVFNAKIIEVAEPIQWLKSNRLLAYLFYSLYKKRFIQNNNWQSLFDKNHLFNNSKGKRLNANDIAVALNYFKDFKGFEECDLIPPKFAELIDNVILSLKV